MTQSPSAVSRLAYAGVFFLTLSTLMFEILLTRIFSVTMWYHFAFMAISVAMFGMTVGAICVYQFPNCFTVDNARERLTQSSFGFAVGIVASFLIYLQIPYGAGPVTHDTITLPLIFIVIAAPFVFSGIAVTIALTKFPSHVSKLYAVDLAGAALGCVLLIFALEYSDGPTTVILVATLAAIAAALFAVDSGAKKLMIASTICVLLFGGFTLYNTKKAYEQRSVLRLHWVKGGEELERPYYEKWNSFSRIKVDGASMEPPLGWGVSDNWPRDKKFLQMGIYIDSGAGTAITNYTGKPEEIEHLKHDITNLAHVIRKDADVLVVGVGGGRDVLSALAFDQKSVTGVEINENIVTTLNKVFGDFSGHLDQNPKITFAIDEARSYVARTDKKFDIFMVSLIDTWAATAAGAYVLSENSLYTTQAWDIFLDHLNPGGVLTFSRFHYNKQPNEMYRVLALAVDCLQRRGITNPRDHIIIAKRGRFQWGKDIDEERGIGTILVSLKPFTDDDLTNVKSFCEENAFQVILSKEESADDVFTRIASGKDLEQFYDDFEINIHPPTDNSPFFFQMLRMRDFFNDELIERTALSFNNKAINILGVLLITVTTLTLLCIILPLALTTRKETLRGSAPHLLYFAGIGMGFMLVEISLMQKLIIFLGHPVYSLAVVLFSLLVFSGIGSFLTHGVREDNLRKAGIARFGVLIAILAIVGLAVPHIVLQFDSAITPVRIAITIAMLAPMGLFMGMAFPIGIKNAGRAHADLTPWLWGINGATSVTASVLSVAISITTSIPTAFWCGVAFYVLALAAFAVSSRSRASV